MGQSQVKSLGTTESWVQTGLQVWVRCRSQAGFRAPLGPGAGVVSAVALGYFSQQLSPNHDLQSCSGSSC